MTQRPNEQRTVAQKMGVRPHGRDYLHLFATKAERLREDLATCHPHLRPGGMLWVFWPKGGPAGTGLNMKRVIAIGYDQGLVESICLRVDDTRTGLKFTHPKPDKVYRNSYGTLPWQRE